MSYLYTHTLDVHNKLLCLKFTVYLSFKKLLIVTTLKQRRATNTIRYNCKQITNRCFHRCFCTSAVRSYLFFISGNNMAIRNSDDRQRI